MDYYFDLSFFNGIENDQTVSELVFDDFKYFLQQLNEEAKCFLVGSPEPDFVALRDNRFYRLFERTAPEYITVEEFVSKLESPTSTCFKFIFLDMYGDVKSIREEYGLYACRSSELNDIWQKFHSRRSIEDLKRFIRSNSNPNSFNSWRDLIEFQLPINTFVISDNYLFEYVNSFEFNFTEMLKSVGLRKLKNRKVDIVIVTSEKVFESDKKIEQRLDKKKEAFRIAKKIILQVLGSEHYNLTLLFLDRKTSPNTKQMHFRTIFTNTTMITCGHSFTLFGPHQKVNKEDRIEIASFLWKGVRCSAILGEIKNVVKAFKYVNDDTVSNGINGTLEVRKRRYIFNESRLSLFSD